MINRKQVVYKTELYKLYKRKDTWIFLTVILVPILYSVGIASGSEIVSYSGNGNITAINFISAMFQMAQSMFIFNIILVAITSRTLGTEIEDKSLRIYLNKVGDRKKIYIEKVKALSVYAGVISVLADWVRLTVSCWTAWACAHPRPAQRVRGSGAARLCARWRAAGAHLRALPPGRKRDLLFSRGH